MTRALITRADDFGSAHAANAAILEALRTGYLVRNVSCMTPGPCLSEGAKELAAFAGQADLGLHLTLNSEWDTVKWGPCALPKKIPALRSANGYFPPSGEALQAAAPPIEQVLIEAQAQLDLLTKAGLPISYLDGHMFPDRFIPGLGDALRGWCREKGLLYASDLDRLYTGGPAFAKDYAAFAQNTDAWLRSLPASITLYIIHPAQYSPETRAFANKSFAPGLVAWERELEYRSVIDPAWRARCKAFGLQLLRFRDVPAVKK